ncbi:hypothetical protein [Sorangium sp. So ce1024]|uniref:hypothetical protein n=1 Tax=unclassified Sorangium TaxID=2621164 RepID=UPI003F0199D8
MSTKPDKGEQENNTGALPTGSDDPNQTQIPVDSKLSFINTVTNEALLHVAVTGSQPPPNYAPKIEYWSRRRPLRASIMSLESVGFTNRPGTPEHAKEFQDWLTGGSVISTAQEVSSQQWIEGAYTPQSPNSALYWAVDPDQPSSGRIGLLVERGSSDELLNMTWYKMVRPKNGLIFQSMPAKLKLTQVLVNGKPSTQPTDIDPNTPWFYFHCSTKHL